MPRTVVCSIERPVPQTDSLSTQSKTFERPYPKTKTISKNYLIIKMKLMSTQIRSRGKRAFQMPDWSRTLLVTQIMPNAFSIYSMDQSKMNRQTRLAAMVRHRGLRAQMIRRKRLVTSQLTIPIV